MNANAFKSEVLVSSSHPVLGRVYWSFVWNGDCNYPDYYGITDSREFAMRLPQGWRDHDYLHWAHRSHVYKVFDPDSFGSDYVLEWGEAAPDNDDQPVQYQRLKGTLANLQSRSGQSIEEFRCWMFHADWQDIPYLQLV
ncbi:hypothetical protein RYA99_04680 [Pseudomonas syringae pv. actinidifoliorum]|nr:hypothetical protein [Pseudomonas syringae pv. actinidifoliorum]MDU8519395.1 hypothetical protein [Pseudomonas syringae pv. actinidifoliorum]MDU8525465.1 hypothetical protein [Pseudomonas syringae pv. actinidifoliorum]